MKLTDSSRAMKTANNVFFGLSMISGFIIAFQDAPSRSAGQEFARNAAGYTWLGFLTLWVISMLVSFACDILKKDGRILLYILRGSCAMGAIHICFVPLMFVF